MDFSTFRRYFIDLTADEEAATGFAKMMLPAIEPLIKQNSQHIKTLVNTVKKQQQTIDALENEVEIMKQQLKRKTLIITGLKVNENEDTEQAAMRLMKDKLKVNLHPMDIDSLYSARKKMADSTPDVVITLTTTRKKIEVMRSKKNLRHQD